MLEQDDPVTEPGEGHLGNVGFDLMARTHSRFATTTSKGRVISCLLMSRAPGTILVLIVCLAAASCESLPNGGRSSARNLIRAPAEEVQAELMAFTDSYTAIISQAFDRIGLQLPEHRAVLHKAKLRNVQNAINIAADQNPIGGLLDMTVMVSLQRIVAEDYWIPQRFGDSGLPMVEALQILEQEIWLIADRALDEQQAEALRLLIPEIRERYRGQVMVSAIRASDFAEDRRAAVAKLEGGNSLLTLFQLDPLAGLNPATRELAQSRLLAERAFFWAKRLPIILNWQIQDVILNALAEPETQRIVDTTARLAESSERLIAVAEELLRQLPEERDAAFKQLSELMATEREAGLEQLAALAASERDAALNQAFEGLAAERESILRTFEQEDVRLRGLLVDLRQVIDAGTSMSDSLTTTIASTQRLRESFARPFGESGPVRPPFSIGDYQATVDSTAEVVRELNQLLMSLEALFASPNWDDRAVQIRDAAAKGQGSLDRLVDRIFVRALLLILALVLVSLAGMVLYRRIVRRAASA